MLLPGRLALCFLALWVALAAPLPARASEGTPAPVGGFVDLRGWDFAHRGTVELDGDWLLHPGAFDDPGDPPAGRPVPVPGPWNRFMPDGIAEGFGTYAVTIACDSASGLGLSFPVEHSAVHWYVNGRLVSRQGDPAPSADAAHPAAVQRIVQLVDVRCPLHVVAHVSNFEARRGGLMRSIELGDMRELMQVREWSVVRDAFVIGALVLLGVLPLVFYLSRRKEPSTLYFGLFCLCFALGVAATGTRLVQPLLGALSWDAYLRFGLVSWYAALTLFVCFLRSLHPADMHPMVVRALGIWVAGTSALTLLLPAGVFSALLPWTQGSAAIAAALVGFTLVKAWRRGRRSAGLLLLGTAVLTVCAVHDVLAFQHLTHGSWAPIGVFFFVAAPAHILVRRLSRALSIEERLAIEGQQKADLLVRATNAGLLDWNAITGKVATSDRYREMLGWPSGPDAAEPPPLWELLHPDDRERVQSAFVRQLRDRSVRSGVKVNEPMEWRMRRTDGEPVWVHAEAISVCDAEGRTLRFICSFIDITQQRTQQEQLRAQMELTRTEQRRLELVVRGAQVGIVDWDGHTHETYYSPIFRRIRGYAPDADTSDWPDYFKVMIHPEDRERITRRWVAFIKGKGPEGPRGDFYAPEEYRLLRGDGSYVWVRVSGMAVRDDRDFVVRWIAAVIDMTERRAQEEALRASRDRIAEQATLLEQQNEALKENVRLREEVERIGRHDIKTPLNSIVAVPRLLREERRLGPEADELLGVVERAGYRILSMVNLSLDLYKMEQGSYVFRPDAVDLADLAAKVIADVRMHAESKQVRIECDLAGAPFAWAEELLCYSLLANLLKNAVEASPPGATVSVSAQAGSEGTVAIRIHNQGAVPAAVRATFFQKYASMGKASGTGLGTYSARLMARVQDGDVAMATDDVEGTTLTVVLRAAPPDAVPATARHLAERRGIDPAVLSALPPTRVLLVDDDEYNLLIVRRFLPAPPFTVETAINGRVALAAAQANWPGLVFMDLDMPVMGGMEAVSELRALQRSGGHPPCAIVALSSHDDEATRRQAIAAGFDRYLTKPVTREVIHETLLALCETGAAPPSAASLAGRDDPVVIDEELRPIVARFIQSRLALLDEMDAALGTGAHDEMRRIAHKLAGSFALYGFAWAGERARWIEHHGAANAGAVPEAIAELRGHLQQARAHHPAGSTA
jgi:PAS domain S-box-containing protein